MNTLTNECIITWFFINIKAYSSYKLSSSILLSPLKMGNCFSVPKYGTLFHAFMNAPLHSFCLRSSSPLGACASISEELHDHRLVHVIPCYEYPSTELPSHSSDYEWGWCMLLWSHSATYFYVYIPTRVYESWRKDSRLIFLFSRVHKVPSTHEYFHR